MDNFRLADDKSGTHASNAHNNGGRGGVWVATHTYESLSD
jgi:hypothetical protein